MILRVEVTAQDIAEGQRGNCQRCPVALALVRATGDSYARVYVNRDWQTVIEVRDRTIPAPSEVARFVAMFDCGNSPLIETNGVRPFTFDLFM